MTGYSEKRAKTKPLKSVDGDNGCAGEMRRRFIVGELGAEDRIKVKNPEVPIWRTKAEFLKKAKRIKLRANYRALNETCHSVLKKITGSIVRAITVKMQNIEVAFKILAYAAYSKTKILLTFRVFY